MYKVDQFILCRGQFPAKLTCWSLMSVTFSSFNLIFKLEKNPISYMGPAIFFISFEDSQNIMFFFLDFHHHLILSSLSFGLFLTWASNYLKHDCHSYSEPDFQNWHVNSYHATMATLLHILSSIQSILII